MNFYDEDSEMSDERSTAKDTLFSHVGGVIVGLLVGAIAAYGMMEPSVNHLKDRLAAEQQARLDTVMQKPACGSSDNSRQERIDELTMELWTEKKQNALLVQHAVEQGKAEADNLNVATVLYEPAPSAASVTLTVAGRAVALPGVQHGTQTMQPRWYVPGKVTPIVYGAADANNQFIWVDAQGNHFGPFPAQAYAQ